MLEHFGIKDLLDIILVAFLLYYLFKMVKISGMRPLFIGLVVFLVIWVIVSRILNMVLLGSILDQFVNIGLILVVILFQDEIRRFLMSLGSKKGWRFIAKLFVQGNKQQKDISHVTSIVLACMNMAKVKTGALIVIQDDMLLSLYEQTGEIINADVSSRLIENIFFKNSPLHDGATIIVGNKINQYKIGIENPDGGLLKTIKVNNKCIVTSGGSERFYEYNGIKYHHIIDPNTKFPANHMKSVTIISEDCAKADFMSTTLFLMDIESGKAFAKENNVDVIWYSLDNKMVETEGINKYE